MELFSPVILKSLARSVSLTRGLRNAGSWALPEICG